MPNGCSYSVVKSLNRLERKWGDLFSKIFKTITVDNGVEFSDCKNMKNSIFHKDKKRTLGITICIYIEKYHFLIIDICKLHKVLIYNCILSSCI